MWLLQSVDDPPESILYMTHGEVVISKHKDVPVTRTASISTVGSASTLSLCGSSQAGSVDVDPWIAADPWGPYNQKKGLPMTQTQDGVQQLADRVQQAVLAKMPISMEQDDVPDRLNALEGQVQLLMTKHNALETQVNDFSTNSSQQFAAVQHQLQQQSQNFHGQLEPHAQGIQAMFTQQMDQIRGLLSKRPRDDTMD